ncbi:MAG TPA: response regulator transcription factor [Firmicutes bacterium]|nr:response regulator transcription factor [Bacillota bacterium]
MQLRALIVDDEYPARAELRHLLSRHECIEVRGEASNAQEAWELLKAVAYDVVFLDIELPGLAGIDLAEKLKHLPAAPQIVFVTAFDEYAARAFAVPAFDYLLKPVRPSRLQATVQRLWQHTQAQKGEQPAWLTAEKEGRAIPVAADEIVYAFAENDRTFVCTRNDQMRIRLTLEQLWERLPKKSFYRAQRSYIVNVQQIKAIRPYLNGAYLLQMNDRAGSEVPVSRHRVQGLKELFGFGRRSRLRLRSPRLPGRCDPRGKPQTGFEQ